MSQFAAFFTGASAPAPAAEPPLRYRLLLVDDEPSILHALQRVFRQENYDISTAPNGEAALALLKQQGFHVMISDYMMPVMNGADLLRHAKQVQPEMIRIMLTGHADTNAVMAAIKEGAVYKFILKPWNDDDLRVTIALALEQYELVQKNQQLQRENAQKTKEISALSKIAVSKRSQLGSMLNKRKLLSDQQLQELYRLQLSLKEPAIKLILERGWVTESKIRELICKGMLIEEVALAEFPADPIAVSLVPKSFCERQLVVPLKLEGRRMLFAMADPMDSGLLEDIRFVTGLEIQPAFAPIGEIRKKIRQVYPNDSAVNFEDLETLAIGNVDPIDGIEIVIDDEEQESLDTLLQATEEPPAIRLVNAVILEAVRLGASDIHIQPRAKNVVVRYRIDGVLSDKIQIPESLHSALVSRLKVMSELDIAERRRPQDGRFTVKTAMRIVDVRISTLPTINGEKVVMRILDRNAAVHQIEQLNFSERHLAMVSQLTEKPQGIVLTTGPTGSGKTTTLYSLLQHNATPGKNYVTIEDPVEYYLDMAGQVLIKDKIGLSFPVVLRSILRQDPDVILIGEIRDFETAEVAFHAALTGHLVYSTLHTNSTVATLSRLLDLGLKPYVIATALEGIIAQRLVRKICPYCKQEYAPEPALLRKLGPHFAALPVFYRGRGCDYCHDSGYKGRLGIYDVLALNDELRFLIASSANIVQITQAAQAIGASDLLYDAREKVASGLTTVDEILRVLGPQG